MRGDIGSFYADHGPQSDPGGCRAFLSDVPDDLTGLASAIQGACIHDVVARDVYGCDLPADRQADIHIRSVEARLRRLRDIGPEPLGQPRPPGRRIAGRCHQFALLLVALLRERGVPARMRLGFAAFFDAPRYEDHVICEYWTSGPRRWVRADPQLDPV